HQLCRIGRDGIYSGRHAFRLGQINRAGGFVWVTESRPISQHLALFPSGQEWKTFRTGRTLEGKKAIAVNSRVPREHLVQLLAAHAFDRITPKAFHSSDDTHCLGPKKSNSDRRKRAYSEDRCQRAESEVRGQRSEELTSLHEDLVDLGKRDCVCEGVVELPGRCDAARGADERVPRDSG